MNRLPLTRRPTQSRGANFTIATISPVTSAFFIPLLIIANVLCACETAVLPVFNDGKAGNFMSAFVSIFVVITGSGLISLGKKQK